MNSAQKLIKTTYATAESEFASGGAAGRAALTTHRRSQSSSAALKCPCKASLSMNSVKIFTANFNSRCLNLRFRSDSLIVDMLAVSCDRPFVG